MAIKQLPGSKGLFGSKAAAAGVGFLTGGPLGAGLALAGSSNPSIGKLASVAGMAGGVKAATAPSESPISDQLRMPELGESRTQPAQAAPLPKSPGDLRRPEIGESFKQPAPTPQAPGLQMPQIGDSLKQAQDSAIGRRLSVSQSDPQAAVMDALAALRDPSVPDYIRQAYVEPLLMAKHFGGRRMG